MKLDSRRVNCLKRNQSMREFIKKYIPKTRFDGLTKDSLKESKIE